ncbi:hypothetical protein BDV10DRAFT_199819 [Aspergillus recurvatus]
MAIYIIKIVSNLILCWVEGTEKFPPGAIPKEFHSGIEFWLYFGMLDHVLGGQLDQSDFLLRGEEGQEQYITTKHLQKHVGNAKDWKKNGLAARSVDIVKKGQPGYVRVWMPLRVNETEQMVRDGWCALDAEKCRSAGVEVDTGAYLLQLTHESCTKTECVADNDGGIPLVMITLCGEDESRNQRFEIEVAKKRTGRPYIAIFHVWADGLGNPQGNTLPHSRRGDNSVLAWIDTMFIPIEPEVRSLTIQRMRSVSYRTMILDAGIRQVDLRFARNLELCLRSRLYVLLSDRAVNISTIADELLTKPTQDKIPIFQERIVNYAGGRFVNNVTRPSIDGAIPQDQLTIRNWFNVATRASSKDGDRPIVFFEYAGRVCQGVLFQDAPQFEEDGMRWALKVCRHTDEIRYLTGEVGKIMSQRLQVTEPRSCIFPFRVAFDIRPFDHPGPLQLQVAWEQWLDDRLDPGRPLKVLLMRTKIPIDLRPDAIHGIIAQESKISRPGSVCRCAVVSLQTTEDEVHFARYTSIGTVQYIPSGLTDYPKGGYLVGAACDDLERRDGLSVN